MALLAIMLFTTENTTDTQVLRFLSVLIALASLRKISRFLFCVLSGRLTPFRFSSAVKKLYAALSHFGQAQLIDELDDVVERRFDNRLAGAGNGETEQGALPQLL